MITQYFVFIWDTFLYQPLFNLLIWLYENVTQNNLGWAVVSLTIILRFVLLPFTLVTEKAKAREEDLEKKTLEIEKSFKNDPVLRKQEVRKLLKNRKVSPWSRAIVLGVQILVLVLLYQVFISGITGERIIKVLYPAIDYPGKINTVFYGFELGQFHDLIWPGIVAVFLLVEIYLGHRKNKNLTKSDLAYFILFPAFSFVALWLLPMVKSLFILTTMIFSVIIHQFSKVIFKPKPTKNKGH
jgi:membrane protein insertase Oxa1/YidC/SpoIIIJ